MSKKNDAIIDVEVKFLYQIGQALSERYGEQILDVYDKIMHIPQEIVDEEKNDPIGELTPADYIDDLAMIMYEVEEK